MKNIAIIGGTSHISKNLIYYFLLEKEKELDCQLHVYARNDFKMRKIINLMQNLTQERFINKKIISYIDPNTLFETNFDVIINCIGPGTDVQDYSDYFRVTEAWDNLIIDYLTLRKHPDCLYINFSSGTVHKKIDINNIQKSDFQAIAKINSEAKHRSFENLNILDLRLYAFFSRFADLENDNYFINKVIKCIRNKKVFETSPDSFIRDFIHPEDLYNIIREFTVNEYKINKAYDVMSRRAIDKFAILNYFKHTYNLVYDTIGNLNFYSSTGKKDEYYPKDYESIIDYVPEYTSLGGIVKEAKYFLED
jgi:hypothetical protein